MNRLLALLLIVLLSGFTLVGCNTPLNLFVAKDRKALVGTWVWTIAPEEVYEGVTQGLEEREAFEARVRHHEEVHGGHDGHSHDHGHAGHNHAGHDHDGHDHDGHDHDGHDHDGHDHAEGVDASSAAEAAAAEDAEVVEGSGPSIRVADLPEEDQAVVREMLGSSGLALPQGDQLVVPDLSISQRFDADGSYVLSVGSQRFYGRWEMPNQSGSRRVVVVNFDQNGVSQRLIMWVSFVNKDEVEISDEHGVAKIFTRQ